MSNQEFVITYAYDVPHYAKFVVNAANEEEALAKANKAKEDGLLNELNGNANYDLPVSDERIVDLVTVAEEGHGLKSIDVDEDGA